MLTTILPVVLFLIVGPLMWMLVTSLVAVGGGWRSLASQFRTDAPAEGETHYWTSMMINFFGNYRNTVNVTVGPRGLHLVPMFLFRFMHPPLFIPWGAVSSCAVGRYFVRKAVTVEIPRANQKLRIFGPVADVVSTAWSVSRS